MKAEITQSFSQQAMYRASPDSSENHRVHSPVLHDLRPAEKMMSVDFLICEDGYLCGCFHALLCRSIMTEPSLPLTLCCVW